MSDQINIPGLGIVYLEIPLPSIDPRAKPLDVELWERERAQKGAELTRQVMSRGVEGRDELSALADPTKITPEQDPILRRVVYGLLGALDQIEPWHSEVTFFNGWGPIEKPPYGPGAITGTEPAGEGLVKMGVCKDPFGFVHWRGGVQRTGAPGIGTRELILIAPAKYGPSTAKNAINVFAVAGNGLTTLEISTGENGTAMFLTNSFSIAGGYYTNPRIDLSPITPYDSRP